MLDIRMLLEDCQSQIRKTSETYTAVYRVRKNGLTAAGLPQSIRSLMPKGNRFPVLSRCSKERYEKRIREKIPDRPGERR